MNIVYIKTIFKWQSVRQWLTANSLSEAILHLAKGFERGNVSHLALLKEPQDYLQLATWQPQSQEIIDDV